MISPQVRPELGLLFASLLTAGCCMSLDFGKPRPVAQSAREAAPRAERRRPQHTADGRRLSPHPAASRDTAPPVDRPTARRQSRPTRRPATAAGPVPVVVFMDYQCPYCRRHFAVLQTFRKRFGNRVRITLRQHPLPFHPLARGAALTALAAGRQGRLWEMSAQLFTAPQNLAPTRRATLARNIGLDLARFERALTDPALAAQIDQDTALALRQNARGTPTTFVGQQRIVGAKGLDALERALVAEERARR